MHQPFLSYQSQSLSEHYISQSKKEQQAKQILQQQSQNISYNPEQTPNSFSRSIRLKTETQVNIKHTTSTQLKSVKKQLVSYSSQRISQISKRLAEPRNLLMDKQNKFKSVAKRKITEKTKEQQKEKYMFMLPSITTLKTEQLKGEMATVVAPGAMESTTKITDKWIEKRSKPSKIEELIQKLEVIKKSNQKRSMQKLPFIFIQSINEAK